VSTGVTRAGLYSTAPLEDTLSTSFWPTDRAARAEKDCSPGSSELILPDRRRRGGEVVKV